MSLRNIISEKILLPAGDIIMNQSVHKHLNFLQKSQWWSEEELTRFQNKKLCDLVHHAYNNVEYYKELFDRLGLKPEDIRTKEDLNKLPVLTKEIVRENMKTGKIVARNIRKKDMFLLGSSGSTGEPVQFYVSNDAYSFNVAANLRGWYWMGYRLGDFYVKLSQNPRDSFKKKLQDKINNCQYMLTQSLSVEEIENITQSIESSGVKIIRGYPSTIYLLAEHIEKSKSNNIKLKAINTTGEILFPHMRKKIEQVFDCKIFDSYTGDGGATVFECETHDKYHISSEYAITEIIPNQKFGHGDEKGEIISTDLWNYAVPFIRYNSKDVGIISKEPCSCQRKLPVLERIEGRDVDILLTPSGKSIIVHFFTVYFEWIDSVSQFQVVQNKIDEIILKLVVNEKYDQNEENMIYKDMVDYIGKDVNFSIEIINDIPTNPRNGKRRFVINNVK